jgi:hypothetical protein
MKELIRKILREEYSPAGKEIIPNRIIVHKSNPMFRDNIMSEGLKAKAGECYRIYVGYGTKCKPAIFATNSTNKRAWFDSTYDDDIWFIDTTKIPDVKWFKDRHFESTKKHIVTFDNIPPEALTLKYEGTGRDSGFINEIKDHPNPEKFNPYKDEIDRIVYSVVSEEEICGYRLEYFLNAGEDALQIVLYYNDGYYPGHKKHTDYAVDIKSMIENYLPIVNMAFVAFDSTVCKKRITENVDEIEKNLKIINLLLSEISWDGLCDMWVEYNEDDGEYEIRSKTTSRNREFDEELSFLDRTLSSMGLRVFIFAPWFVDSCEDEVKFLNESEEETDYIEILKDIVEPFKEDVGVCDIDLWYDDEDDMYSVYLVFGTEELNDKFTSDGKFGYVRKKQKEVEETIKSYLPIKNIRVGSYGTPYCGWKSLNESKEKSKKDLIERVLNDLVLPQYEHIICGFELKNVDNESLGNVINYPGVIVKMIGGEGTRMWPNTPGVQKMYDDLLDEVWETVWDYTGISLELYSNYVKECNN